MLNILDFGCGNKKRTGSIGIDINPNTAADIIHDLNVFPYPFADSTFDEIYADNVLEHLDNIVKVMEELYRISKPDARIKVIVPYFRSRWAFIDPTHKHFFTVDSFAYFTHDHIIKKMYNYSFASFRVEKMVFNETIKRSIIFSFIKAVANFVPQKYEIYMSHFFPLDDLSFYLRTVK